MKVIMSGRSRTDCAPYSWRVYRTVTDRKRALTQLRKFWTHIVVYLDTQGPAISLGHASWTKGRTYVDN